MPDYHAHGYDQLTDTELLEKVRKGWRSSETPCGFGSTIEETARIRAALPKIAEKYAIKTVADAGAGDLHWMPRVRWDVQYEGFDLMPRHKDVTRLDITKQLLPAVDLILCRHVLNHLSIQYSERALNNFKASGSRYLLMTNCKNQRGYWADYGMSAGEVVETWKDSGHWDLELYRL
jgi:hypothetical protein